MKFETWLDKVDSILERKIGMDHNSIPDYCWWDLWDSELTPHEAVQEWEDDPDYGRMSCF